MRAGLVFLLAACWVQSTHAGGCRADSGRDTVALVELYTARNCAGCARAELWLSELKARRPEAVLPVVVPMDERDSEGEPKAWPSKKFTVGQRFALVYRPYVVLQGREFAGWNTGGFDAALAEIHARAPGVRLTLRIVSLADGGIDVAAEADAHAALYLAAYRLGLERMPLVTQWQGPFAVRPGGSVRRTLPLPPGAAATNSGVLGFVQRPRTAEVLQALRLPAC